jgi:hypothetical protein
MFRFYEGISTWYTLRQRAGSAEIRLGGAVEHGPGEFAFERRLYAERKGVTCSDVKRKVCIAADQLSPIFARMWGMWVVPRELQAFVPIWMRAFFVFKKPFLGG